MTNSADPDQLASSEANSGSTLFAKTGYVVFSKRRVKGRSLFRRGAKSYDQVASSKSLSLSLLFPNN